MAILESLANLLGISPYGENVAMNRWTHTPIVTQPWSEGDAAGFGRKDDLGRPAIAGMTTYRDFSSTPIGDAWDVGRRGVNPFQPFIQLHSDNPGLGGGGYPGGGLDPETLRHETMHVIMAPLLDKDPNLLKQIQTMLPDSLKDEVRQMWGPTGETSDRDLTHEGAARFLTSSIYDSPKWNKTKQQLISLFPTEAKGKIIRMLSTPAKPITEVGQ